MSKTSKKNVAQIDMPELDLTDVREVFDLFDFWDGRDGLIDAYKVADLLRCLGLNPTQKLAKQYGGTEKLGEKQYTYEDFLAIVQTIIQEKDTGTVADFLEAFKSYDREGLGYITGGEMRQMLTTMGEQISDQELDSIMNFTDIHEDFDGNVKFEPFIKRVMDGGRGSKY